MIIYSRTKLTAVILTVFPQLRNGNIHYVSDAGVGGKVERTVGEAALSDGQWHTLQLLRNGSSTVIQVDNGYSRVLQRATQDFGGLGVATLSLGGIPSGPAQQKTGAGEAGYLRRWRNRIFLHIIHKMSFFKAAGPNMCDGTRSGSF